MAQRKGGFPPELHDRNWILEQRRAGLKTADIAEKLGCSVNSVQKAHKNHGIKSPYFVVHNPELQTPKGGGRTW